MALSDNLISYWEFENNGNDSHASNNATMVSATYTSSGFKGGCYSYSGSSYGVMSNTSIDVGGDFTVSFWVYLNNYAIGQWTGLIGKYANSNNYEFFVRYYEGSGTLAAGAKGNSITAYASNSNLSTVLPLNQWNHIVLRREVSSNTFELYVNNTLVGKEYTSTEVIDVGNSQGSMYFMYYGYLGKSPGKLDECGLWDRCLSTTEISNLYNSGKGLSYEGITTTTTSTDKKYALYPSNKDNFIAYIINT